MSLARARLFHANTVWKKRVSIWINAVFSMSGVELLEVLRDLQFPKIGQCDESSFDWLFDFDEAVPFLQWFCHHISCSNRVKTEHLARFRQMQETENESILDGKNLEEMLNLTLNDEDLLTESTIEENIKQLEEDLSMKKKKRISMVQQKNKLSTQQMYVSNRLTQINEQENKCELNYRKQFSEIEQCNIQMNEMLNGLVHEISTMTTLYGEEKLDRSQKQHTNSAIFLSRVPLEHYYKEEEKFTRQLTQYTKKQFDRGMSKIASGHECTKYDFLEVTDPASLMIRGKNEDINIEDCNNIAKLHLLYPKSQLAHISATLDEQATKLSCEFCQKKIQTFQTQPYPTDVHALSALTKSSQTTLHNLKLEYSSIKDVKIVESVKQLTELQAVKVLMGDYELKIGRQKYFVSNQEKVIHQLLLQRGRVEFISLAYELELKFHKDVTKELTTVAMFLDKLLSQHNNRIALMKDPAFSQSRLHRNTIDSRDNATLRIHSLLAEHSGAHDSQTQLYVPYTSLIENAERLKQQNTDKLAQNSRHASRLEATQQRLESSINRCEGLLFADATTSGRGLAEMSMTPRPISNSVKQLQNVIKKMEGVILNVMNDLRQKEKMLKLDRFLPIERQIWVQFFNDPSKLVQTMADLERQVQANLLT